MRYLDDLRDAHKGREIWVIGCGPSIEAFPEDFFGGKVSIALNWAHIAFPNTTYVQWYHSVWGGHREYAKEHPEILGKTILPLPHELVKRPEDWGGGFEVPIWMRWTEAVSNRDEFAEGVRMLVEDGRTDQCRSRYTVAHTAIQAAVLLGARDVTLAGCEHHVGRDSNNSQVRGMGRYNQERVETRTRKDGTEERVIVHRPTGTKFDGSKIEWKEHTFEEMDEHWKGARIGTWWLASLLGERGIRVRRYFYPEGYREITQEETDESY